jgi:GrpB-like predicted nucleotidyltransferase (UPF0157 family)
MTGNDEKERQENMKVRRLPREHFNKLADEPIEIRPFDPECKQQSFRYLAKLNEILAPLEVSAELFGSVELEIAGKGEWEFAIWLTDDNWYPVLTRLINHFGSVYELSDDFVLFEDSYHGTNIEVISMRGETAEQNQAIMNYWRNNPTALKAYEEGKHQYLHSKREYYWWKSNLIADILESL